MSEIIERARALRKVIEQMASGLSEEEAVANAELFPEWIADGNDYAVGDKVRYNSTLYKVLQAHTSQPDWTPDTAVSLYARILAGQEGTEVGEWEQPDSTNPYKKGDRVIYNGKMYESTIDGNVWSPEAYPQGWQEVIE